MPGGIAVSASTVERALTPEPGAGGPLVLTAAELFIWFAVAVALPGAAALLVVAAPALAAGLHLTPRAFGATHAFTLGVGSSTVMGAAYQMSSALLGSRIWGERFIAWQMAAHVAGTAALVGGFLTSSLVWLAAGGTLVTAGAWAFVVIMARTGARLGRARRADAPGAHARGGPRQRVHAVAMILGTAAFALVTVWGLFLALSMRYPWWPQVWAGHRGLVAHLALGFAGWFGMMVVGVSYRLLPIVHGARITSEARGLAVVGLLGAGVALVVAGALSGSGGAVRAGVGAMAAAAWPYTWEVVRVLRHRRRRAPDLHVGHWWAVLAYTGLLGAWGLAWAAGWVGGPSGQAGPASPGVAAAVLFLVGWVVQAILGQLYKVTPFLMWYYRAFVPDVLQIPAVPDLYAPRAGRLALALTNAGTMILAGGILAGRPGWAQGGAVVFAAGALVAAWVFGYSWIPAVAGGRLAFGWRRL